MAYFWSCIFTTIKVKIVKNLCGYVTTKEKTSYICGSKGSELLELEGFDEKGIGCKSRTVLAAVSPPHLRVR